MAPDAATDASATVRWRLIVNRAKAIVAYLTLQVPAAGLAQTSSVASPDLGDLRQQLQEMRSQMDKLQNRIQELESAPPKAVPAPEPPAAAPQAQVSALEQSVEDQERRLRSLEEPTGFHYKGLTLTPGGFLEASAVFRTRNENADIATSYSGAPLNGSSNSKLSEFRGTARNSELSLLVQGSSSRKRLSGYVETDFLGAAPTANYVQSSGWTPRLRQLWAQLDEPSGWTLTGGQMWSLITSNREGIATLKELRPVTADGNYVVGFSWTRERAFRVTKNFHNGIWAAFALEDPESTYSAAYVPPNVMGLNTSQNASTGVNLLPYLANYSSGQSTTLAPDIVAKLAVEPGWGHFELKALGRFFRDRTASTADTVGHTTITTPGHTHITEGYGVGFNALMPVVRGKLDISAEGMLGQGIGRYGASGLPDVTIDPASGEMRPLREARIMLGVDYHPTPHLELYAYGGDEYVGRHALVSPTGTAAGYGSPLVSYAQCTTEVALNTCSGANRNIYEGTVGYWYRLFQGDMGRVEYGNQVAYIHRNLWNGIGPTPQGSDLVIYSTLRFYLP
jgi:hypothetical protein